ncbi:unnamed protein product [Polarella glacialis]|uniref:CMP/dCMP-type deaminase domain-containing protein n=1 Tax=Polarella glacialis TaxID=89957 RepID=A0A813HDG1_POLGL|nr:unnamed protein product [Polarella glacialis]
MRRGPFVLRIAAAWSLWCLSSSGDRLVFAALGFRQRVRTRAGLDANNNNDNNSNNNKNNNNKKNKNNNKDNSNNAPQIQWPRADGPFSTFETYGWQWHAAQSVDENLISLVLANRLNSLKFAGFHGGPCSAVLCRPRRTSPNDDDDSNNNDNNSNNNNNNNNNKKEEGAFALEVLGLGVNAPPRFAAAASSYNSNNNSNKNSHNNDDDNNNNDNNQNRELRAGAASGAKWRAAEKKLKHNEIHAEMSILARCARAGIPTAGAWMCIQMFPCWECCKALIAAGIVRVVFESTKKNSWHRRWNRAEASAQISDSALRQKWGRSMLAAKAAGLEWVPVPHCPEREEYIKGLWQTYKERHGLDRDKVKDLASLSAPV